MADYNTTFATEQSNRLIKRNANPSLRPVQHSLRYAVFDYTFAGTEADTETILLGSLGVEGAKVVPELSRIRDTGGGQDIDVDVKLSALVDGVADDLSGTVSIDNAVVALTGIAGEALIELDVDDQLLLTVDDAAIGAVTAGETISVEIAYYSPNIQ